MFYEVCSPLESSSGSPILPVSLACKHTGSTPRSVRNVAASISDASVLATQSSAIRYVLKENNGCAFSVVTHELMIVLQLAPSSGKVPN